MSFIQPKCFIDIIGIGGKSGDVLKHASDAGDAGDAGYLLKTYNQPCNSLLMSALYETMNSDAGKY